MVTDNSQPATDEPQVVSVEDFRRFQSAKDQEIADLRRAHQEERRLNDELARDIADTRAAMTELRQQGYSNADPEMVKLQQQLDAEKGNARKASRFAEDLAIQNRDAQARVLSLEYAGHGAAMQKQIQDYISGSPTKAEMDARVREVRAKLGDPTQVKPPAPKQDEIDTGRSRGGQGTRITRESYSQHLHNDPDGGAAWRKENAMAIEAWQADGSP